VTAASNPPAIAGREKGRAERAPQRLYLVTPLLDDTTPFVREIDAVLGAADIAAVLLRLKDSDERTLIKRVKSVAETVQRRDIALLIDNRPEIVARTGADGAHLTGIEVFAAAVSTLKPDRIAGCGGLHSRHDAMLAGETGADYVMFGEPDRRGNRPPLEAVEDRLNWWAELLEIPCIGYAANEDDVRPLAQAGADFIALGEWIWTHPGGAREAIAEAARNLALPHPSLPGR
jgi:thiamine-phosphate pyrophosphorylase